MPTISKKHIDNMIENGYEFSIGEIFNKGFNFYTQNFWKVFISYLVAGAIPFLNYLTLPNIYRAYASIEKNDDKNLNELFNFDKAGQVIVYYILMSLIALLLFLPFFLMLFNVPYGDMETITQSSSNGYYSYTSQSGYLPTWFYIYYGIIFLIGIISFPLLIFSIPLILFGGYGSWEAFRTSIKLAWKRFFPILGLMLLAGIVSFLGIFICGIGIYFTLPISTCIFYFLFKTLLFSEEESENIEQIGKTYQN